MENIQTNLIGGIGLTRIKVYDQEVGPDNLWTGSPHVHAITSEAYYVLQGEGEVMMDNLEKGHFSIPLKPGQFLQFPPKTLHRLINKSELEILGMMGNAGLAEQGDARIYFGKAVDDDPEEYQRIKMLPKEKGLAGALERRDLATKAYMTLMELWNHDKPSYFAELQRFFELHQNEVISQRENYLSYIHEGPLKWGNTSLEMINQPKNITLNTPVINSHPETDITLGMCGLLYPIKSQSLQL